MFNIFEVSKISVCNYSIIRKCFKLLRQSPVIFRNIEFIGIQIIISGLALMGKSDSHIAQTVEGVLLILILFVSILAGRRKQKEPEEEDAAAPKASGKVEYPE